MELIMKQLCEQLGGWNFYYYKDKDKYGDDIYFDFYSNDGSAILTMHAHNNEIKISNDVEYYSERFYADYENITLDEYEHRLEQGV